MSRSSVCLQDFCLGLVKPRQRNSHPGLTLECWCPSAQSPRSASTFQICCAVLSIPKSSRTSQRSRLWLGSSNLAESSSHVLLGAVLLLPKSFQMMGRERSGGKTSAQSVQRIIGICRIPHGWGGCSSGEEAEEVKGRLGDELFHNKGKCGGGNSKSKDTPEFSGAASQPTWSSGVIPALGRAWTRWTLKVHSKPNIQGF